MARLTPLRFPEHPLAVYAFQSRLHPRCHYSSGSPSSTPKPANYFNKTGKKDEPDPAKINMRSDEYSKSGGDDIVAEQAIASFEDSQNTDPMSEKERAGRGNVVNPLDISPATPEISRVIEEQVVEKNVERDPNARTGQGVTRKAKKVEKTEIDFRPK